MQIELSPKQIEYLNGAKNHRWGFKIGGRQSGKTHIDIAQMIPERILERAGKKGLNFILGVTKETIERNVLEPMRDFWRPLVGDGYISAINSRNVCTIFGEKVYCIGAENVGQASKMRGAKIKYLYIDEIVDINREVFEIVKAGLSLDYSACDATGNPANPQHWVKKFMDSDVDIYAQKWTIYDNPFLSPEVVRNFEREYAGTVFFERYIRGEWAQAQGLVYPMFDEKMHVVDELDKDGKSRTFENYWISMDYGIQNATSMGLWGLSQGVYYRIKEYYYSGRDNNLQKTDDEYYAELERLAGELPIERVIIDPSAASFIALIRKKGKYRVKAADNAVVAGIADCCTVLQRGIVRIYRGCKNIIREFGMYSWNEKAAEKYGEDEPLKQFDHAMDDFRYFVYTNKVVGRRDGWH